MTAGKVMSAIKVDMCRRQQPLMPGLNLAPTPTPASGGPATPDVLDVMRTNRRRGAARVCLFGAPEPGATRALFDEMLGQQHAYMLNRYQFDMRTDRYVGADKDLLEQNDAGAETTTTTGDDDAELQERLHGAEPATDAGETVVDETQAEAEEHAEAASSIGGCGQTAPAAVAAGNIRTRSGKANVSGRHSTKPYDRPSSSTSASTLSVTSYRPITEFFRKSKKTCPTALAAAKLHAADVDSTSAATVTSTTSSDSTGNRNDE